MPRILQLELSTLTSDIARLRQKISVLQIHATKLGSPNEQTNTTLREYSHDVAKLTDRSSRLFDRFYEKIDLPTRSVMEDVFCNASSLRDSLAEIYSTCSTDLRIPEVSASLLKNVRIPRLNITKWCSPGFYCQAKDLINHISRNRFQDRYYIDMVLSDLKQNERLVYESIADGPFPDSVQDILENISTTHMPPIKVEAMSIEVLRANGRIEHPVQSTNIRENTNNEIAKRSKFQAVLRNIIEMWNFFQGMYIDETGFRTYVHAGCYTPKFCSVLLEANPREDKMRLLAETANLDYRSQIHHFFESNNSILQQLYVLTRRYFSKETPPSAPSSPDIIN